MHWLKFLLIALFSLSLYAEEVKEQELVYSYIDRHHTFTEHLKFQAIVYGISWAGYIATQPNVFLKDGSFKKYKKNFGQIVFDKDEATWNWIVHPFNGGQIYLFYRANGYSRLSAVSMTFIQSALFEFTAEVYTEPASIQDLYQTPILGSIVGLFFEFVSLDLLNSDSTFLRGVGHVMNPSTLFEFYEGRVYISPTTSKNSFKPSGIEVSLDF